MLATVTTMYILHGPTNVSYSNTMNVLYETTNVSYFYCSPYEYFAFVSINDKKQFFLG